MNRKVIQNISKITGINLLLIKQLPVKEYLERPLHYLCEDKNTKKKYLLAVAYSKAQIFRLEKLPANIQEAQKEWGGYFDFNKPIKYGFSKNNEAYFVLFNYFENTRRSEKHDNFLENTFIKIQNEKSYTQKITPEVIEEITNNLIKQRCPQDEETLKSIKMSEKVQHLKDTLAKYDEIKMVKTHCVAQYGNLLLTEDKKYLLGSEYGWIDLPIGFDILCIRKYAGNYNTSDIPYLDLHQAIFDIQYVGNNEPWLAYHNPVVNYSADGEFLEVSENGAITTIAIEKSKLSLKNLIIDFSDINISPCAAIKVIQKIGYKYPPSSAFNVRIKNSPYKFNNMKQSNKNILSFTGVINNDDYQEPKNIIEAIKQSQAFLNYSRILPFVKPYWFRAILAVAVCIPIGSLDAVIALSLKPYMDLVMVEKTVQSPWYIPFGIVAFTSIQGMLNYLATYLNAWVGGKITNDLKFKLYQKLLNMETAFFDTKKSGDIVYQFSNDANIACQGLLENLKTFVMRLFSSLSLIGVLIYNSWQLALIAIFVLGCAFAPLTKIRKKIKDVMDQSVSAGSAVITVYNESYAGNKTIASYNLKDYQEKKFSTVLDNIFSLSIKMIQRTSWLSPMMHVIVSVGIGVAIGYGSHLILTKQITSGNFVSFITALIMLYTPIKNLGNNFNAVQFSFMAIERVFKILERKPALQDAPDAKELTEVGKIEFKNVSFEYIKDRPVLKNINLEVKKGQTVALVGNSGGGKSTIINLIPRFYDVNAGEITINGTNIRNYTLQSLREKISVVFQDNFLFSGTIRENIMLGNQNASEENMYKAIKMAYLDEFVSQLQKGVDTQIGERGMLLSGGQKQRVAIARAFLKDAPIVILDEATSALDNKSESIVQKAIENLMQDKTVFVIAHRLSTIQNADKIVVINQGEIVEEGSHSDLLNICGGAYKSLYEMQFKKQEAAASV